VVLTDWMMPHLSGLELTRKIRSEDRFHYTYVIMITALGGRDHYIEGMSAGADDFVTKPVDPAGLCARLRVAERILSLQAEAHRLEGLLPVCMYCKNIRDAGDRWQPLEEYVGEKAEINFSPDLCPGCRSEIGGS
jgi:PleD family two-component response regulator